VKRRNLHNFCLFAILMLIFLLPITSLAIGVGDINADFQRCEKLQKQLSSVLELKKRGLTESDAAFLYLFITEKLEEIEEILKEKEDLLNELMEIAVSKEDPENDADFLRLKDEIEELDLEIAKLELGILKEIKEIIVGDEISFGDFIKKKLERVGREVGVKLPSFELPQKLEEFLSEIESPVKKGIEKGKARMIHVAFKKIVTDDLLNTLKIIGKVEEK